MVEPGLTLSAAALNAMRREVLTHLTAIRGRRGENRELNGFSTVKTVQGPARPPRVTVGVLSPDQLTPKLIALRPVRLYAYRHPR